MSVAKIEISREAIKDIGLVMPYITPKELAWMVRRAARCTHPMGNKRYKDYIFNISATGKVLHISRYLTGVFVPKGTCPICGGTGKFTVYECGSCGGVGCDNCSTNLIKKERKCTCNS